MRKLFLSLIIALITGASALAQNVIDPELQTLCPFGYSSGNRFVNLVQLRQCSFATDYGY